MIKLIPVAEEKDKLEYVNICRCPHYPDALFYGISEGERKIGLCEFTTGDGEGKILLLRTAPDVHDPQALILGLRAALFFMDNIGIPAAVYLDEDDTVARAVGFSGGRLTIKGFFDGKCAGTTVTEG